VKDENEKRRGHQRNVCVHYHFSKDQSRLRLLECGPVLLCDLSCKGMLLVKSGPLEKSTKDDSEHPSKSESCDLCTWLNLCARGNV
jgi:hypothetical protein